MELQLTEPGYLHTLDLTPTNPIVRWKVVQPKGYLYIRGFHLGRPGQKPRWRIAGRKTNYNTAEEALAALKKEHDASQPK